MPHIHEWFLLHILSLFLFLYPGPLSLPSQEVDCHGNVVQERVEQAMEEIKDRLAFLEKRGRAEVREKLKAMSPCNCDLNCFISVVSGGTISLPPISLCTVQLNALLLLL